jgi:hypothetical protein
MGKRIDDTDVKIREPPLVENIILNVPCNESMPVIKSK